MNISVKHIVSSFFSGLVFAALLTILLFFKGCFPQQPVVLTQTDTVFINKPYKKLVIKTVEKPVKVFVYKTDTVFRKIIEKDTLITGVEFNQKMAKIHTITPKGLPLISEYPVLNYRSFAINHKGEIAFKKRKHSKRKKLLRILSHTAAFACGVWLAGKK